jgi:hypothetical protein
MPSEHIGQEQEAVIGWAVGYHERSVVGVRDAQQLGLSAGHLPIQLRVAEQRCSGAVLVNLRGLTLGLQSDAAHEAMPARDVERDNHPVTDLQVRHAGADRFDDTHRFVTEHVTGGHERGHHRVQV